MQSEQNHTQGLEKPLVSFILTYYNLPVKMLCECIDSILALTMQPCEREIIVVDDGSDNSPMNDLMKYGDDIIYIRQIPGYSFGINHVSTVIGVTASTISFGVFIYSIVQTGINHVNKYYGKGGTK